MGKVVRIPITNGYMGVDYTGRIYVGWANTPLNVLLDTGSGALAVDGKKYKPQLAGAGADKTSNLAQTDAYGDILRLERRGCAAGWHMLTSAAPTGLILNRALTTRKR